MIYSKKINPIIALFSGMFIIIFGLVGATSINGSYFLIAVLLWLIAFGFIKSCIKVLPGFIIIGGLFALIAYLASNDPIDAMKMANRFGAILLAVVPGMSIEPIRMTRNLSQLHAPRHITLGMLIAMSFSPTLRTEVRRVKEAMKTRGAGSILNPKIFYRAFLIPFVMRIINISDTLALSVELRGFTLEKANYTVYRREKVSVLDIIFILGILVGSILVVVL